jgi:hypothetical protein
LDRRRTLRCPDHKDTDFVMALPDGSLPSRYDSGVRRLLKSAGLLIDPKTGRNRGIYSARHSYATWRLQAGASSAIVADNMGTSLRMLEQHYYHHQSRVTADSLMKGMTSVSNDWRAHGKSAEAVEGLALLNLIFRKPACRRIVEHLLGDLNISTGKLLPRSSIIGTSVLDVNISHFRNVYMTCVRLLLLGVPNCQPLRKPCR